MRSQRRLKLAALFVLLAACPAIASPSSRASELLATQVAGMTGDATKLTGTFANDATLLVPGPRLASSPSIEDAIRQTSPHEQVRQAKVTKQVTGGDDSAVWLSAEVTLTVWSAEPGTKAHQVTRNLRITELATAASGWKVVAGAFSTAGKPTMQNNSGPTVPGATDAGPLTAMLVAPDKLVAALTADAAVFGTDADERAYGGAAAKKLASTWSKLQLSLSGRPREMKTGVFAFALANVDWARKNDKYPLRLAALVIGRQTDAGWRVVAVHYTPL